jgi:hypothetical protein
MRVDRGKGDLVLVSSGRWQRPNPRICRVLQLAEYQIVWFNFCAKSDFLDKGKLTI